MFSFCFIHLFYKVLCVQIKRADYVEVQFNAWLVSEFRSVEITYSRRWRYFIWRLSIYGIFSIDCLKSCCWRKNFRIFCRFLRLFLFPFSSLTFLLASGAQQRILPIPTSKLGFWKWVWHTHHGMKSIFMQFIGLWSLCWQWDMEI